MKVALYARVSTEEQTHGLSIDTQLDNLRAWAKEKGHTVVDEYVDLGVSARKAPAKRPELQRLLSDLARVELIVFTKLDRWTRNVKGYYDVQEQLDKHKVAWTAIQEDYETLTSSGRFKVNIMLSVAENEADRTSERIKSVFDRKVERGEFLGSVLPLGLMTDGKKVVPDGDADLVRECFRLFLQTGSVYQARAFLERSGRPRSYAAVRRMLHNPLYCGQFRGNMDYCPAIVSQAEWDEAQRLLAGRSFRENQTSRVYLFSGLIRCAVCGRRMAGAWAAHGKDNALYRCNGYYLDKVCGNKRHLRESAVEAWLLDNIADELRQVSAAVQSPKKEHRTADRAAILKKLDRLKDLYVDGLIDKAAYKADREKLLAKLPPPEEPVKDLSAARTICLTGDFRERYAELTREEKRALWRSLIDHMSADADGKIRLFFSP